MGKTLSSFIYLLIFIFICSPLAIAQKIKKEEVDPFNKIRTISTTDELLVKGKGLSKEYIRIFVSKSATNNDSALFLHFKVATFGYHPPHNKDLTELLFSDGTVLEIFNFHTSTPYEWGSGYYKTSLMFQLSDDDVSVLKSKTLQSIRVRVGTGILRFDQIPEKNGDLIKNSIQLIII